MKTPKEKAEELVNRFYHLFSVELENTILNYEAKQCALITINEITKALRKGLPEIGLGTGYWHSVKQEIEKL